MKGSDKLHQLIETVQEICADDCDPPWGDLWDREGSTTHNINMFTFPNPLAGTGLAPYVISPDFNYYARLFGYSLQEVFTDAEQWACFSLEQTIWNQQNLQHDSQPLKKVIINQLGFFAPGLFGMMPIYSDDAVPRIPEPIIRIPADLARLDIPDFHTSGLSALAHRLYAEIRELLPEDFTVEFPTWITGPFGTAYHLRGPLALALDLLDNPDFVHELMGFIVECMKSWLTERSRFLGHKRLEPIMLGNDEVGVPMISPAMYEEFVLPYEIELAEYFGGVDYWHSCSDVTPLLSMIARIPNFRVMDVGPRTLLQPAVELFGNRPGSSIMKRPDPVREILLVEEEEIARILMDIKARCYDIPYMLFFSGILPIDGVEHCTQKILQLDRVCQEIFHSDTSRPSISSNKLV